MKKMSFLILGSVIIPVALSSVSAIANVKSHVSPQLQLQGDWTRNDDTYGLGVLLPYTNQSAGVPFLDLRYYQNENDVSNASVGLGYRHSLSNQQFIGINSYYDTIKSKTDNNDSHGDNKYNQASVGIEYVNKDWEARANYYTPINEDKNLLNEQYVADIQGDYLGINTTNSIEELNDSADLEIGRALWQDEQRSLKMYLGVFWQQRNGQDDNTGFRLKSQYDTNAPRWLPKGTSLGFGSYVEHDNEDLRAGVQLKFNFGGADSSDSHNLQHVRRELVMTPEVYSIDSFERATNYGRVKEFSYDSVANSTNEDVQTVNQQIANLGDNGLALMSGAVTFDDSLIIGENQTLFGFGTGSSLLIETKSGKKSDYIQTTPAVITNSSRDSSVIKIASNSVVDGVTIKGGLEGIGTLDNSLNSNVTTLRPQTKKVYIKQIDRRQLNT